MDGEPFRDRATVFIARLMMLPTSVLTFTLMHSGLVRFGSKSFCGECVGYMRCLASHLVWDLVLTSFWKTARSSRKTSFKLSGTSKELANNTVYSLVRSTLRSERFTVRQKVAKFGGMVSPLPCTLVRQLFMGTKTLHTPKQQGETRIVPRVVASRRTEK